jgi:hypothetical protein
MNRKPWLTGLVLISAWPFAHAGKTCKAYRMTTPVKVDGILDEGAWKTLPVTTGFLYNNKSDTYAEYQTAFQLGYDDKAVYVAFRADEPRMAKHLEVARKKDTKVVDWGYQLVEVFLDPETAAGRQYFQFAFDILGHKMCFQAQLEGQPYVYTKTKWQEVQIEWDAAVTHGSDHYVMEIAIPFKSLGQVPKPGDKWGLQVGRSGTWSPPGVHWQIGTWTVWSPMGLPHWRNCNEHGLLEFELDALLPEYAEKFTKQINREFYEWQATHGERMKAVRALIERTKGRPNLLRQVPLSKGLTHSIFGQKGRGFYLPEEPSSTWHVGTWHTDNLTPQTILLEWETPIEFNCHKVGWLTSDCHATDYALEYWDGAEWKVAYSQMNYDLPVSCHVFPKAKASKIRLTIAGYASSGYYLVVNDFGLYLLEDAVQGEKTP